MNGDLDPDVVTIVVGVALVLALALYVWRFL